MPDHSPGSRLALPLFCVVLGGILLGGRFQHAQAQRVSIAPRVSTLGAGADVTVGLSSTVNLRVGGGYLPVSHSGQLQDEVDVQYVTEQVADKIDCLG